MKITYAGHSCFVFEGSKKILTDPMPVNVDEVGADITLLTHAHGDHIGNTPENLGLTCAVHELACYLKMMGVNTIGMNIGGSKVINGVKITMVSALHSSSIETPNGTMYMGCPCGYIITMDRVTIYHAGDTGIFSDMKLIGDLYHPDIAILPAGGVYTMGPEECMMAAELVGAKLVIPMHYNTFPAIRQDLTEFKRAVELTGSKKVELMKPGEALTL